MKGSPPRRTSRLLLRAPEPGDVDELFAIQGDAVAMQYTFCASDRQATEHFLRTHAARFDEDGYAPWTAVLTESGRIAGWGGLGKDPDEPHWGAEVAYFLDPSLWGRGLATEIVRATLEHAFDDVGLSEVSAFARPANAASARVLAKCGFERLDYVPGLQRHHFLVTRVKAAVRGRA